MKFLSLVILALVGSALLSFVHADSDSASGPTSTPTMGRGKHGGGKKSATNPSASSPGMIKGTCAVIESPSNPIAGPCVTTMVILNDINGNEVARDRTTAQGQFEFTAEQGKAYKIAPGSKFYDLVSPTTTVHGGDKVTLQLRQK